MKSVLAWVKTNLVSVICVVVALVVLPAGYFVSNTWGQGMREERQKAATSAVSSLKSAEKVEYSIFVPGREETIMSQSIAPNRHRTAKYKEFKDKIESELGRVVSEVNEINARDYAPLIDGLFPSPPNKLRGDQLALEFVDRLVGEDGASGAYAALLREINAGPGSDNDEVRDALQAAFETRLERLRAQMGRQNPTPEEMDEIRDALAEERLAMYQRNARRRSLYADNEALLGAARRASSSSGQQGRGRGRGRDAGGSTGAGAWVSKPEAGPDEPPSVAATFAWQHDYWVVRDTLLALDSANEGARGVPDASVKRLLNLRVAPLFDIAAAERAGASGDSELGGRDGFGSGGFDQGDSGPSGPPSDSVYLPDPGASITGRVGSKGNELYDLRRVEVVAIVASDRIDEIIAAIESFNLISVLDWRIDAIDPYEHLTQGYFYGNDHVAQLTLQLESLWLREWTKPLMPSGVRAVLGVPEDPPEEGDEFN